MCPTGNTQVNCHLLTQHQINDLLKENLNL
jgi:hypothetical protein